MKIVIHAGRHKTGTTYLQQFLGKNAPVLLKNFGILYPEVGRNKHYQYHHEFFQGVLNGGDRKTAIISKLEREIEENKPKIVLFSSEYLSRSSIQSKELTKIKDSLPNCDIEIIFYLRRQDDFLCSRYSERVKRGAIAYPMSIWEITAELDYFEFLERYASVFGQCNLNVRSYDNAIKSGLIDDFSAALTQPDLIQLPRPHTIANNRLPWRYLHVLWYANSNPFLRKLISNRSTRYLFRKAARYLPSLFDGRRPITDSEAERLLDKYAKSNETVAEIYTSGTPLFTKKC